MQEVMLVGIDGQLLSTVREPVRSAQLKGSIVRDWVNEVTEVEIDWKLVLGESIDL